MNDQDVSKFDVVRSAVGVVIAVALFVSQYRSWRAQQQPAPGGDGDGEPMPAPDAEPLSDDAAAPEEAAAS